MTANEALIHSFYATFQKRDAATMKSCYHPEVHFHDPAFQDLHGAEVGAMWQMLIERGGDPARAKSHSRALSICRWPDY